MLKKKLDEGELFDRLAGALHGPEEGILGAMHGDQEPRQVGRRLAGQPPHAVPPGSAHTPCAAQWCGEIGPCGADAGCVLAPAPSVAPHPSSDEDLGQDVVADCMDRGRGG